MAECGSKMNARPARRNCSNGVQKDTRVRRHFHEVACCWNNMERTSAGTLRSRCCRSINAHNRRMPVVGAMTAVRARHLHHGRELVQSQRLHNATACRLQFEAAPLVADVLRAVALRSGSCCLGTVGWTCCSHPVSSAFCGRHVTERRRSTGRNECRQ